MGLRQLLTVFWGITLILLINQGPFIHGARYQTHNDYSRNISCFVCFQYENIACGDRISNDTVNPGEGIFLVDRCHLCAIRHIWDGMEGTRTTVERFCLIASQYGADDDCSYQYDFPPGSREVVETCRCQESFCNGGDISELGGKGDINSFPKEVIYHMSGSETMRLYYYQHAVYILVLKFMMQTF